MNSIINVRIENDRMITDSRNVAEVFSKRHDNVIRDIENLKKDVLNFEEMFFKGTMPDSYGRDQKAYFMTRDGFTLLAMGFTGKDAMQWKLQYIEAFNKLAEAWNSPEAIMARALQMANNKINSLKMQNSELFQMNKLMQPKAEYYDELVDRNLLTGIRETAKELHMPERKFTKFLIDNKLMYRDNKNRLMPYAQYVTENWFEIKESFNEKTSWKGIRTLITPKGRDNLRTMCKE